MRKNALTICCFVCAFGAFGAFFRWLQNQIAVDHETGVMNPSILNVLVPAIIIAAAVVFYFVIRSKMGKCVFSSDMYETFRGTTRFLYVAAWIVGAVMIIGGLAAMLGARFDPQAGMIKLISLLAILTGASFPSICSTAKKRMAPGIVSTFSAIPILMLVIWLIACYMRNSSIPNVWSYAIEIIAVCAAIVAFYSVAGYSFGKPRPYASLYSAMLGAFMCCVTLADSRYFGLQMIVFAAAAMLLMYCWMIVSNMREAEYSAPAAAKAAAEALARTEEAEEEPEPAAEEVIAPGLEIASDEPTLQAPERKD